MSRHVLIGALLLNLLENSCKTNQNLSLYFRLRDISCARDYLGRVVKVRTAEIVFIRSISQKLHSHAQEMVRTKEQERENTLEQLELSKSRRFFF